MTKQIKTGDLVKVKISAPQSVNHGLVEVRSVGAVGLIYARDKHGNGDWYAEEWLRHLNWIEKLFYKHGN